MEKMDHPELYDPEFAKDLEEEEKARKRLI